MRILNKMKKALLVVAALFCVGFAFAETKSYLVTYGNMTLTTRDKAADGYSTLTGNAGDTAEGIVMKLLNKEKDFSSGSKVTLPWAGAYVERTTVKLSNGAQTSVTMPAGWKAIKATVYSYVNLKKDAADKNVEGKTNLPYGYRTSYWKEFAGVNYKEEEATLMNTFADAIRQSDGSLIAKSDALKSPDAISFEIDTLETFTLTNAGEQPCFVMVVEAFQDINPDSVEALKTVIAEAKAWRATLDDIAKVNQTAAGVIQMMDEGMLPAADKLVEQPTSQAAVDEMLRSMRDFMKQYAYMIEQETVMTEKALVEHKADSLMELAGANALDTCGFKASVDYLKGLLAHETTFDQYRAAMSVVNSKMPQFIADNYKAVTVPELNALIAEAKEWIASLDSTNEMIKAYGIIENGNMMIPAAEAVAKNPKSQADVEDMIFNVYSFIGTYKPIVEQYYVQVALQAAVWKGDSVLNTVSYDFRRDNSGLASACQNGSFMNPMFGTTIEEMEAATADILKKIPLFIAENKLGYELDKAMVWHKTLDAATQADLIAQNQQMFDAAGAVAKNPQSTAKEIEAMLWDVEMYLKTYKDMIAKANITPAIKDVIARGETQIKTLTGVTSIKFVLPEGWAAAVANGEELIMNDAVVTADVLQAALDELNKLYKQMKNDNALISYVIELDNTIKEAEAFVADLDTTNTKEMAIKAALNIHLTEAKAMSAAPTTAKEVNEVYKTLSEALTSFQNVVTQQRLAADLPATITAAEKLYNLHKDSTYFTDAAGLAAAIEVAKGMDLAVNPVNEVADAVASLKAAMTQFEADNKPAPVEDDEEEEGTPMKEVASWNFKEMDITLATGASAGFAYNQANSQFNEVFACTNEGLEAFAFQALADSKGKGWSIQKGTGLVMGSGAGRCAALTGLEKGQVVDVYFTGDNLYVGDNDTYPNAKNANKDIAAFKDTLVAEAGHYQFLMLEDGALALELDKGKAITEILVQKPIEYEAVTYDFAAMSKVNSDKTAMTYSDETVNGYTWEGKKTALNLGTGDYKGLAAQGANNFILRTGAAALQNANSGGRSFGVLNLTKGQNVTVISSGTVMNLDASVATVASEVLADGKYTTVFTMIADGMLNFEVQKSGAASYLYSISYLAEKQDIQAPEIVPGGNSADIETVTLTCATEGAAIYYSVDKVDTLLYEAPFTLKKTSTVAAWSTDGKNKSKVVEMEIEAGIVALPTASITDVQGISRTVALAAETGASITYSLDGETYQKYVRAFLIKDTTTVYAVATRQSAIDAAVTFVSDTAAIEIIAGEEISLVAPSFNSVEIEDILAEEGLGNYVVVAGDQSSILNNPEATISYEFFKLNPATGRVSETADKSGVLEGETSEVMTLPYGLLKAIAKANGYADAENHIWIKAAPVLTEVWHVDFDSLAVATNEGAVASTEVKFNGKFRATSTADFANITIGDVAVDEHFTIQAGTSWLARNTANSKGLYNYNSGDRAFGFYNLRKNQVLYVEYQDAAQAIFTDGVIEQDMMMTNGNSVYYNVTADGNATIGMNRNYTIHKVAVYMSSAITQTPDFSIAKVDGTTHYLNIESGTLGADIYYAIGAEEYEEVQVITNDTTGGVAPIYGTKIDTTVVYGDYVAYTEPIALSEATWVRAYAWYQDIESEVREQKIEAGVTVQLAQPVILFAGNDEAGLKTFTISVDNSGVISAPTSPIYYTLPGGEETLYDGGVITVAADVYGWMNAVAKLEGYEASAAARRYIDARETYNEGYAWIDENTAAMQTEVTGDLEIDYTETMNVAQPTGLRPAGRIFYHRPVENGLVNLVTPFNMTTANFESGLVYVTDETGKVLTRGVDFIVRKVAAEADPASEEYTGNIVSGGPNGYLVQLIGGCTAKELIFVSAPEQLIAITNNTFTQPTSGMKVITNRLMSEVVVDFGAYVLDEAAQAFVLVEGTVVVPAFQTIIVADAATYASTPRLELTGVSGIDALGNADGKEVESVKYYNVSGMELSAPVQGEIIIKVITYVDGTTETVKAYVK